MTLVIGTGSRAGESVRFPGPKVWLGRTEENDLVLEDPGVSRRHACLFVRGGAQWVEDVGSSNGTKLNGQRLTCAAELHEGDTLALGSVALAVTRLSPGGPDVPLEETGPRARPPPPSAPSVTPGRSRTALFEGEESSVTTHPARPSRAQERHGEQAAGISHALVRTSAPRLPARGSSPRQVALGRPPGGAAARARRRRLAQRTFWGRVGLFWEERSKLERQALVGAMGGLVFAVAALGVYGLVVGTRGDPGKGSEPSQLGAVPITASFGWGPGVTWPHRDGKRFDFELSSAVRVVVVAHASARRAEGEEVAVVLNGLPLAVLPPPGKDGAPMPFEQVLPPRRLHRAARNTLGFERGPRSPELSAWSVSNLWLEVLPVPEVSDEEALRLAQEDVARARRAWALKDVGAGNLFKAWKNFRQAWVLLEVLEVKPELYAAVRAQLSLVSRELDLQCAKFMLEAKRSLEAQDVRKARRSLEAVASYFPTTEHRCHNQALEKLANDL